MSNPINLISNLYFVKVKFILSAVGELHLPVYKGSVFRGTIMNEFKKVFCPLKYPACVDCSIKDDCIYFNIFETENSNNKIPYLDNVKKKPHPFVLEPPETEKTRFQENDEFELNLILIGKFSKYLTHFIFTINELGKSGIPGRGKFKILDIRALDFNNSWQSIVMAEEKLIIKQPPVIYVKDLIVKQSKKSLEINFITPTRIQKSGRLTSNLTAELLFDTLYRRLINLCNSFCDGDLNNATIELGDVKLTESELRWKDWERISNRQKTRMKLGGIVGKIKLQNVSPELFTLLKAGSYLHIGKNTAFGLGRYELSKVQ